MELKISLPKIDTGKFAFGSVGRSSGLLSFSEWLPVVTPSYTWEWNHLAFIRQNLDKITSGECKRLMIFTPPRHGKSEQNTVRYPVYRLEQDPSLRVIVAAYNQTLANKFSRKSRRIATGRLSLSKDRTAVEDWETEQGGGLRAVGVGGGITGQGGNLILIDDPVKSRDEANSQTYRDKVYDWYTDDLYTRLEPGGAIVLTMTRWHEDDLAGRILASEDGPNWTVINLPALAEENDPLGRAIDEALCPARYTVSELLKIRTAIGSRTFAALYQQRPVEQEGGFFKRSWFTDKFFDIAELPKGCQFVRYWDKGATAGDGDYTVGLLMAKMRTDYYILDIVRGQWSTGQRDQIIKQTAFQDRAIYGRVGIWVEQEPGSSGKDSVVAIQRLLDGFVVRADKVTGDKLVRAEPFAAACEAGRVYLLKMASWVTGFIDELTSIPNGKHDDQMDTASGAYNKLAHAASLTSTNTNFYGKQVEITPIETARSHSEVEAELERYEQNNL